MQSLAKRIPAQIVLLAILVGTYLIVGASISGFPGSEIRISLKVQFLMLSWFFFGLSIWISLRVICRKRARPFLILFRTLNMNRLRFIEGAVLFSLFAFVMQAYMSIKIAIPSIVPYYAGPYLANIDQAIFGVDPWRITHALISPSMTSWVDWYYIVPCAVVSISMTFWVCFARDKDFRRRAAIALVLVWLVLGSCVALLLSSAGPVYFTHFYGIPRFEELQSSLAPNLMAVQTQNYLLEHLGQRLIGNGISASPSMHNATFLLLIVLIYDRFGIGLRLLGAILLEAGVFVSSVHLGWHFATDTFVSALLIIPIWRLSGLLSRVELPDLRLLLARPAVATAHAVLEHDVSQAAR